MPNLENKISFLSAESVPLFNSALSLTQSWNPIHNGVAAYQEFFLSFLRHHAAMLDQGPEGGIVKIIYMALLCKSGISILKDISDQMILC